MHPYDDKRVFQKEAVSLAQAGFRVTHIAPGEGEVRTEQGVKIRPYPRPQGLRARLRQMPLLYRLAVEEDADAYHCNEVDSWLVGVALKVFRGKTIVFDVHEHYETVFGARHGPRWLRSLLPPLWRLLFRLLVRGTDYLVFAQPSLARGYPTARGKSIVVNNYAPRPHGDERLEKPDLTSGSWTVVHLGLISRVRGWPVLLQALAKTRKAEARLLVIGEFNDGSRPDFEAQAQALGLAHRVEVVDWLPYQEAFQRLLQAHVGVILFQPGTENHTYALPHKMFDYMAAGLAVIVPDFAILLREIVQETGCGTVVDVTDPVALARILDNWAQNPQQIVEMGRKGRRAVMTRYNWENEAAKLIAMYRTLF